MNVELLEEVKKVEKTTFKAVEFGTLDELKQFRKNHHITTIDGTTKKNSNGERVWLKYKTNEVIITVSEITTTYFKIYNAVLKCECINSEGYEYDDNELLKSFLEKSDAEEYILEYPFSGEVVIEEQRVIVSQKNK